MDDDENQDPSPANELDQAFEAFAREHGMAMQLIHAMADILAREARNLDERTEERGPKLPKIMRQRLERAPRLLSRSARRAAYAAARLAKDYQTLRGGEPDLSGILPVPPLQPTSRVMVVDDDIIARSVLSAMILERGLRVVTAKDGPEALGLMQAYDCDLVLMDCRMPEMDGYETSLAILLGDYGRFPPAIVGITHGISEEYRAPAYDAGMLEVAEKPLSGQTLDHLLERYVSGYAPVSSDTSKPVH
ncbi:MAG: response regulator [Gammaproteobacteria bacterium]